MISFFISHANGNFGNLMVHLFFQQLKWLARSSVSYGHSAKLSIENSFRRILVDSASPT